ncbi:hypothetical protein [Variovorax guangxiensis]|uniref:hypothetical protein n=1 Tax=Variovorax guangxiensis TaxID=1775474 RepID=UPI002863EB05|nr:hypothetical protein [Variovorax guangxiensis]MDR6861345.1 hypothetical protein [Variovorax guangxiensis]
MISIAAALVLFALVPVLDHAHLGTRNETGELREFGTNLERVQSALGPGDLGVEERGLDLLDTRRAGEPGLQTFREALHRQVREQAQREQLATPEASKIIPLGAAAVSGVSPTSPLSLATPSSEIAMPAPEARVADPRKKECSEALAALALCPEK